MGECFDLLEAWDMLLDGRPSGMLDKAEKHSWWVRLDLLDRIDEADTSESSDATHSASSFGSAGFAVAVSE